jgi:peptidoglycan/LPS O-acetylase OafA/YrhL
VAGAVAAVANTLLVAVARGVDVPLEVGGEPIPLLAVPQLTIFGALAGIGIAAVAARRARRPQRAFVVTTIGLTAASLVPDALIDTDTATRLVLALAHLVAAAITIPALARRLPT